MIPERRRRYGDVFETAVGEKAMTLGEAFSGLPELVRTFGCRHETSRAPWRNVVDDTLVFVGKGL
jgi:hypothetical protein